MSRKKIRKSVFVEAYKGAGEDMARVVLVGLLEPIKGGTTPYFLASKLRLDVTLVQIIGNSGVEQGLLELRGASYFPTPAGIKEFNVLMGQELAKRDLRKLSTRIKLAEQLHTDVRNDHE